ncbi:uncharacterized protein LOC133737580 [Rosa rugosa]|uniref:uncharacterized protein LOC133737580 n=1 Tax=Rosa rugosa TaxID=74645 RepID=UPI002B4071CD|nr:uncharacterized protein LOC133737580 [Rosa rugosa]
MLLLDEVYLRFPNTVLEYLNQRAEEEAGVEGHEAQDAWEPAQNPQGPPMQVGETGERPQVHVGEHQSPKTREVARQSPRVSTGGVDLSDVARVSEPMVELEISVEELLEEVERRQSDTSARARLAVNMNYHPSGELVAHFDREIARLQGDLNAEREQACELQSAVDRGQMEYEDMRRVIDEGIARRMELERSLAMEEAHLQEAEGAIAPLRARVGEAEEGLQELERQAQERDAELELRVAALESLAPYPDRVVELEGQVGNLQRKVDHLRDVELEAGEREAEMERLRKELAEQQSWGQ